MTGGQIEIQVKKSADSDYRTAGFVSGGESVFYVLDVLDGVDYDIRVRPFTIFGKGTWTTKTNFRALGKLENPSTVTNLTAQQTLLGVELSWDRVPDIDVVAYEGRLLWSGRRIFFGDFTEFVWTEQLAPGTYEIHVRAKDSSGNYSFGSAVVTLTVTGSGPVRNLRAEPIFNNVDVRWDAPATFSFPIVEYEVREGSTFAGSISLGKVSGTFKSIQVKNSGTYTIWVVPYDSRKNPGEPASITVNIATLPFFELLFDQILDPADATLAHAKAEGAKVIAPMDLTRTIQDQFDLFPTTPQDQVDDGYPLVAQPSTASIAEIEWEIDYGDDIAGALINFTYAVEWKDGSGTVTPSLEFSPDGSSWTSVPGEQHAYGTNFRYVKAKLEVEGDDDTSIADITIPRLRLEVTNVDDTVLVSALAADASGTLVVWNRDFIDIKEDSIQVSVKSASPTAVIPGWGISGNDVYVWAHNPAGVRVNADISVSAKGVVPL